MLLTAVVVVEEGITYQEDVCRCLPCRYLLLISAPSSAAKGTMCYELVL